MGEENCLPTVEESTEPPIRAQRSANYHEPPTTAGQHTDAQPHAGDEGPPTSLTAAHTLTAAQVAQELGVDIQYDISVLFTLTCSLMILQPWTQRH